MSLKVGAIIVLANMAAGCDRLGVGHQAAEPDGAPSEQELQKISYMSSADSGPKGRRLFDHVEEAKTCGDFELAMRWNRPPNVEGGMFHKKIAYLAGGIPADLPKDSEVFVTAKIEKGQTLTEGGVAWYLRMPDGTLLQAIEMAGFLEKQDQAAQERKPVALVKPYTPGRIFCGQGVYQGAVGKDPGADRRIPLISVLYAMDRAR